MDSPVAGNRHQSLSRTRSMEKRDDTSQHIAIRAGDIDSAMQILIMLKTNQSGETALYVAAEYGCVDLQLEQGFDAFHIATKQGDLEVLKVLMEAQPELSMTIDQANTTALHTACEQGHIEVVKFLLDLNSSMATIAKSNLKTALHSCARKGHLEVMKTLLEKVPEIATRADRKGQTALHMAAKGQNVDIICCSYHVAVDNGLINMVDKKENTYSYTKAKRLFWHY